MQDRDNPQRKNYLWIESSQDSDTLFEDDMNYYKKRVCTDIEDTTNVFDTFKFIIPKEDEYMELSLCLDSREYIDGFYSKLIDTNHFSKKLVGVKAGLSKVLYTLLDFMLNKLPGKIRSEYSLGQIVPHRQEMVAKVGILGQVISLFGLINEKALSENKQEEFLLMTELDSDEFGGLDSLPEVMIKTLHVIVINNPINVAQCVKNMSIIQRFTFVEGCTSLLIDIFKDKSFELNKKEIHSELLYRRIFEIERFREVIEYFTTKIREVREFNILMILRKMCIIDGNPLPLVQEEIFKKLYQSKNFPTRYELHHTKDQELWIVDCFETDKVKKRYTSKDFMDISEIIANTEERLFLLEQLTLEADL